MKLLSWNVNGIRSVLRKGALPAAFALQPDVLCLQETKAHPDQVELDLSGYTAFWNAARRPGYSGTAVFTRVKPIDVRCGMGMEDHDQEGRLITVEFAEFFLVNVYTPNAGEELKRLPYRLEWDAVFQKYLKQLEKKKPVIVCGDLNVAHEEIDLAHPAANRGHSGFTDEERASFSKMLAQGFVDSFRAAHPGEPRHYSWWTYRAAARSRNIGWRIDYFCHSAALVPAVRAPVIHPEIQGSDHCPVGLSFAG